MIEHSVRWSNANWKFLRTSIDLPAYITPVLCQQISFPLNHYEIILDASTVCSLTFIVSNVKNGLWIELWIDDGMQFEYWGNEMIKCKTETLFKFCFNSSFSMNDLFIVNLMVSEIDS